MISSKIILNFTIVIILLYYTYFFSKTKLLFFIASYGTNQLNLLYQQIKSFILICENGYDLKIIIHHTEILNNSSLNNFYCFTQDKYIDIVFIKVSLHVKHYLVKEHRKYMLDNINDIKMYNHIGFFENDIGFSLANFKYYLYTLNVIKKYNLKDVMPGFKRYEISKCKNGDIWRSCQDHINNITFYNIQHKLFIRIRLAFSAMWILPVNMLMKYIHEKEFLSIPDNDHHGNEGIKPYYSCNYWEKHYSPLIPLNRIDDCFVHHMSNKYIHYFASIQITELYMQMNICRSKSGLKYIGEKKNRVVIINKTKISKTCIELAIC